MPIIKDIGAFLELDLMEQSLHQRQAAEGQLAGPDMNLSGFKIMQLIFVLALAYALTAYGTIKVLAILPSYASAFWPAAGLALVAVLKWGRIGVAGIFFGALSFYLILNRSDIADIELYFSSSFLLATGNTLQAMVAAFLVRRFIGFPSALIEDWDILKFLCLAGPLACLTASTWDIGVLYLFGKVGSEAVLLSWFTWWVGDSIGVITIAPLLLIYFSQPKQIWKARRYTVAIPLVIGLLALYVFFFQINKLELNQQQIEFKDLMSDVKLSIENDMKLHLEMMHSLKNLILSSEFVSYEEFKQTASDLLSRHSDIQALEWIPRIQHANKEKFIEDIRSSIDPGFSITRPVEGEMIEVETADEYFPITYIEPIKGNERAFGFDISTSPLPKKALYEAKDTGNTIATEPITLVQETGTALGIVFYMPVYEKGLQTIVSDNNQDIFLGVIALVLRLDDFINQFVAQHQKKFFNLRIRHQGAEGQQTILFNDTNLDDKAKIEPSQFVWETRVDIGGRVWLLDFVPTDTYIAKYYSQGNVSVLMVLFFTMLLFVSWLLSTTGRSLRTEQIVAQRTSDLRSEIEARNRIEQELTDSNKMLGSIHNSLSLYVQKKDDQNVFKNMLDMMLELTGSEYGFIGEVIKNRDEEEIIKIHEVSNSSWEQSSKKFFEKNSDKELFFNNLDNLFGLVVTSGEVVISNQPKDDPRSKGLPEGHPRLNTYLGVPFHYDDKIVGLISLANRAGGYNQEIVEYLKPFTVTCGSIINAIRSEQLRRRSEQQLRKVSHAVENNPTMVIISDKDGNIEYANPKFCELTGYSLQEVVNRDMFFLLTGDNENFKREEIFKTVFSGEEWQGNFQNEAKDGRLFWVQEYISPVRNDSGQISHIVTVMDDITENRRLTKQLSYQASHDALTGLVNRREFERRLEQLLNTGSHIGCEHALCVLDLDQFKIVNDTSGHIAGDELLRQIGRLLNSEVRSTDTLARLGGDEFALLIQDCSLGDAKRIAGDIQQKIDNLKFNWEGKRFSIGVSIGLVSIDGNVKNMTELFKAADTACYIAKEEGRNRVHVYQEDNVRLMKLRGEVQWVNIINEAFENDAFVLYAQPITNLNNKVVLYEILVRMVMEDGEIVSPGIFLPVVERYQLSEKMDRWVVKNAFEMISKCNMDNTNIQFSINLSGNSVSDKNFLDYIIAQFEEYELDSERICFEITETAAISNLADASLFIRTLKGLGCDFALDDFGSGISSFGYLKSLPVDFLKIDGIFVKDIEYDPIDRAMVKSINEIGQVMGKKTIAEFVEGQGILEILSDIGVDLVQGFYIGKPMELGNVLGEFKQKG